MVRSSGIYIRTGNLFTFLDVPKSTLFTLSKATKLRDVVFRLGSRRVEWAATALQTIGHEHRDLRWVSIDAAPSATTIPAFIYPEVGRVIGEENFRHWLDLDRSLVHLQESRSIRVKAIRPFQRNDPYNVDCIRLLLPEITKRGD